MGLRLLAAAVILAGLSFAADAGLLGLAMPDAQVMAGINFGRAMLSPFGRYLLAQPKTARQALPEVWGFDPRHDLREILAATQGQGGGGLVLARGAFDVPRILEAAIADGGTVETYKGVPMVQGKGKQEPSLALPDRTLAILGDPASVRGAIDRLAAPAAVSPALAAEVSLLSASQDAWFVSVAPPSQLAEQVAGPLALLGNVLGASGGVKFGANVVVTLQGTSATPREAAGLAQALQSLAHAAPAAVLLQNLAVTSEGSTTKVSLSLTEQQIEEMAKSAPAGGTTGYDIFPHR